MYVCLVSEASKDAHKKNGVHCQISNLLIVHQMNEHMNENLTFFAVFFILSLADASFVYVWQIEEKDSIFSPLQFILQLRMRRK